MSNKQYEVFNFGPTRIIPYKGYSLNIQQHWGFITSDRRLVKVLKRFPAIFIREIKTNDNEYKNMNYFKLKQKARRMGLQVNNKMKKKDLINLMEGVDK